MLYEFGSYLLSDEDRQLFRDNLPVQLDSKTVAVLLILLKNQGQVVEKRDLIDQVWPDAFIEDSNLLVHISKLRKALADNSVSPKYIETVHKRGYRFIAEVKRLPLQSGPPEPEDASSRESAGGAYARVEEAKQGRRAELARAARRVLPLTLHILSCRWGHLVATVFVLALLPSPLLDYGPLPTSWGETSKPRQQKETIRSVAVLPFKVAGSESEKALGESIVKNVILNLRNVTDSTILSPDFTQKPDKADAPFSVAGLRARAETVLTGELTRLGEQIHISARLIRTEDEALLWKSEFEEKITRASAESDVSAKLSQSLAVRLAGQEARLLAFDKSDNLKAHELFLKGLLLKSRRDDQGIKESIDYFKKAIQEDPEYVQAYIELSSIYGKQAAFGAFEAKEALPMAVAAAAKAIEIDGSRARGHSDFALYRSRLDWSWDLAEHSYRRALECDSNLALTYVRYAQLLQLKSRFEESKEAIKKAYDLQPDAPSIRLYYIEHLYFSRSYDELIKECQQVLERFPHYSPARNWLVSGYQQKGMYTEALREIQKVPDDSIDSLLGLIQAYTASGRKQKAARVLARIESEITKKSRPKCLPSYALAQVYAAFGERDKVFEWLYRALDERDWGLPWVKLEPAFDSYRSDPDYHRLLRRMNL